MAFAVVEFQAFKDNDNKFIIKELAVVGDSIKCQILFKPPYSITQLDDKMRRTARWLTRHHGIRWDDGCIAYNESLITTLCAPFKTIYTKGREKAEFLREFHPNVREISGPSISYPAGEDCILSDHKRCAVGAACTLHGYLRSSLHESGQYELEDGERLVAVVSGAERARRGSN
jgi:hypothetical protein